MASVVSDCSTNVNGRKRCSVSYKIRCFYSKGALLILFWVFLVSLSCFYLCVRLFDILFLGIENVGVYSNVALVPAVPFLFCAPIIGWIADTRCGNYGMFRVGAILFLLATIAACISSLILLNVSVDSILSRVISGGISPVVYMIVVVGFTACLVTGLQLGLDQMPDASPENITSFIAWFVFSLILGLWVFEAEFVVRSCTHHLPLYVYSWTMQVESIFPVIFMTVMCCSLFLLGPKWLTIEPNCPQSLKTIYKVLKFAWKHKAPLNRSALTYWEEDIPSRIDLGKLKYGGPFTTEEVEDVKTFFRILIIFLPMVLISCSLFPRVRFLYLKMSDGLATVCEADLVYTFTYSPMWVMMVVMVVYELIIYPLIRNWLPSILSRIGILSFIAFILNSVELVMATIFYFGNVQFSSWYNLTFSLPLSCVLVFLLTALIEFVCAQSPYKMRCLLFGYSLLLYITSLAINAVWIILCHKSYCIVSNKSFFTALSLIGFVLYCLLARWYKMRARDEDYNVHRVVEEVYDRYLSHCSINQGQ